MGIDVDQEFVISTLQRLVQIDSRNPNMTSDGPGEAEIGQFVAGTLEDLGLEVHVHYLAPNRVNVVGILKGCGEGKALLLNGHMDTVGVEGMEDPFSGTIRRGRLYGRGSQDMKGSLAAMLGAVKAVVEGQDNLAGELIFAAVADEEDRSLGTQELVKAYQADAAIVTEPTDMEVVCAHRGLIWYQVETFGKAAHGSRYQEGVDAITRMGRFLVELDDLERKLPCRDPHPLTGPPSLHASLIEGGTDICTYPACCTLKIDRRTVPGEREKDVTGELQAIIDRLTEEDETFRAEIKLLVQRPALETSTKTEILNVVQKAFTKQMGHPPHITGAAYWSDAALLAQVGMDAVLLGPVGRGLHSEEEWVDLKSVHDLAQVLTEAIINYCK
ncbi:MAG: ArgE/DapE family deacylase [Anaerolineales bacterium]